MQYGGRKPHRTFLRVEKGEERFMDKILRKKWESNEEKGHGAISQKRGRRALQ